MACCSRYFCSIFFLTMILLLEVPWPARFSDFVWAADPDPRTFTLSEINDAPDPSQTDFTLDECVRRTLELSPAMSSAHQSIEGAEWDKKQALTNFLPKAGMSYSYTRLDERPMSSGTYIPPYIVVPPRPAGTVDNVSLVASISQPIFNGFSLISQYDLASLGLDLAVINLLRSKTGHNPAGQASLFQCPGGPKKPGSGRTKRETARGAPQGGHQFFRSGPDPTKSTFCRRKFNWPSPSRIRPWPNTS